MIRSLRTGLNRMPRAAWTAAAVALLTVWTAPTLAAGQTRLRITSASVSVDENVYELDMALDVSLPDDARRAIDGGLAMRLDYDIEIQRVRRYAPDADVASIVQSYVISYHALSQRYLLRNLNTGVQLDYGTLDAALARASDIRGLPLIDTALVPPGPVYDIRVRGIVDMGAAPDSLRWLLFWSDDWSASSEWYSWNLKP